MTLKDIKQQFYVHLEKVYPKEEITSMFFIALKHIQSEDRVYYALHQQDEISSAISDTYLKVIDQLQLEVPIQYIFGETEFFGLTFQVNENTLIPRQETEELVAWIIEEIDSNKKSENITILDIGTGSGCIPISIAKNTTKTNVKALDISTKALKIAKSNALINNAKVDFKQLDILTQDLKLNYDIIISNPPYVRELEKQEIKKNVLDYEPHLALFVKDTNPLLFYNRIADLALTHLNPSGSLFFEINQYLGEETIELLKEKGFVNIELRKDLFGNDRMIKAKK